MTVPNFTGQGAGKQFEKSCLETVPRAESEGLGTFGRYGVQATLIDGQWTPIASLPDMEGVFVMGGRGIPMTFDCKVCSQSKFDLHKFTERRSNKRRQLDHMLKRADFGTICFFLIHWNERILKTKQEPAETFAYPVFIDHPTWDAFDRGEQKNITRDDCEDHAERVKWNTQGKQGRKLRPNIFAAAKALVTRR